MVADAEVTGVAAADVPVPTVVALGSPSALDAAVSGAKAANLAACRRAGLAVLDGFVVTTAGGDRVDACDGAALDDLRVAWLGLVGADLAGTPLVVRSSSTIEDAGSSSMAGRFTSLLDVRGWQAFVEAVAAVRASGLRVTDDAGEARPIAVLVQPQLAVRVGGVLFGVDPVTGDRRHVVVEAVPGGPDALVSGRATAEHLVLGRRGRLVLGTTPGGTLVPARLRRWLAGVARRSRRAFGAPQDVEWAEDATGRRWVLQSRPVTAVADRPDGVLLGAGPVAETFPDPLTPLEADLWLVPLRDGVVSALTRSRAVSARRLRASPVVTRVQGRAVADLQLLGHADRVGWGWRSLAPAAGARRLRAAWDVGRLRTTLPGLADRTVATVDAALAAVGPIPDRSDDELVAVVRQGRETLAALHAQEVLAGMLLSPPHDATAPGVLALAALAAGRAAGCTDDELVARHPVVLTLVAPSTTAPVRLPATVTAPVAPVVGAVSPRDALRVRTRWVQELTGRAARELVARWAVRTGRSAHDLVRTVRLDDLLDTAAWGTAVLSGPAEPTVVAPLPAAFRLGRGGAVVAASPARRHSRRGAAAPAPAGRPAGGGRGAGTVRGRPAVGGDPTVLVVATLDPALAALLPGLGGLVAETGSALSHLAILARELQVPTVVAVPDARRRFPPGTRLLVDGTTGDVEVLDDPPVVPTLSTQPVHPEEVPSCTPR